MENLILTALKNVYIKRSWLQMSVNFQEHRNERLNALHISNAHTI